MVASVVAASVPTWLGYICAFIAVLCFGTYAVPVGLSPQGDGVFFQWVQCSAILIVGIIIQLAFGGPTYQFEPLAMIGGMLWTIGNCTVVPIVSMIGLGLGVLLWGLVNMLCGWVIGTAGIFIEAQHVPNPALNYTGLVVACVSFFLYFFVKVEKKEEHKKEDETLPLKDDDVATDWSTNDMRVEKKVLSDLQRKVIGISLSVFAGVCYGFNMLPVSYLAQQQPHANPLAFAFSHFTGIFFTSTVIMLAYAIFKRNRPFVEPRSVIGGLVAGTLWACAQSAWFVANVGLSLPVAFPIVASGPGIVANIWGIFYFKEIKGKWNLLKLVGAFAVTMVGILLIGLSKVDFGSAPYIPPPQNGTNNTRVF